MNTPSSLWSQKGEPDPHGDTYNCKRSDLPLGHLTDDQLANVVFLHNHRELDLNAILAGEPSSIALLTAAKERIRWLSREVERMRIPYSELLWNDRSDGCIPAYQKWKSFDIEEDGDTYRIIGVTPTVTYYLHTCDSRSLAEARLKSLEVLLNV